jgi:hypothetical protein
VTEKRVENEDALVRDDDYGEVVVPSSNKKLNVIISVRFSPDEIEAIRDAIGEMNISTFIRATMLKSVTPRPRDLIWSPLKFETVSGLTSFLATIDASIPNSVGSFRSNVEPPTSARVA